MQQIRVRCGPNGDKGQARANVEISWLMHETDWEQRGAGLISGLGGSRSQKSPNLIITIIPMIPQE